jgi:hypothetical protein
MCMIRGLRAYHPCLKCMVGKDELSKLGQRWEPRCPEETTRVLNEAAAMTLKSDQEDLLKQHSLRFGQVRIHESSQ